MTGFGPFPGAPDNPTAALAVALGARPADRYGASALKAVVLPTDYRRSAAALRGHVARFRPDVVVHFGLAARASAFQVERMALNRLAAYPDAAGYIPRSLRVRRGGADHIPATLDFAAVQAALMRAGFDAILSDDAGGYVCNATLYRSLLAAESSARKVGFIHVPPLGGELDFIRLCAAGEVVLMAACATYSEAKSVLRSPPYTSGL